MASIQDARALAIQVGYREEDIRGVAVEPDGTVIIAVEGSDGEPVQSVYRVETQEAL